MRLGNITTQLKGPVSFIGRVFQSFFFAIFFLAGLFCFLMIGRESWRAVETRWWTFTPCVIESCTVTNTGDDYRVAIAYSYRVNGQPYRSEKVARQESGESDFGRAQRLADSFPAGRNAQCYVNPSNPAEAVLRHGSPMMALFILLPVVFMMVGGGGIYGTWRRKPAEPVAPAVEESAPGWGRWTMAAFFGVFFMVGAGTFYSFGVKPVVKMFEARQWMETPCVVVSSEVRSHSDSDGTTYSVNILYRYEVKGREYRSNRRNFGGGSSSGYTGKAKVVEQFPPGAKTVCFVNPRDPTEAVLDRGFSAGMLLGFMPLIFLAVGAGGLVWVIRGKAFQKPVAGVTAKAGDRIKSSNKLGMWFIGGFALFWNAISWPVGFLIWNDDGKPGWVWVFLLFPVVGLFLFWLAIRQTRVWLKFGESFFELGAGPGVVGGTLTGRIVLSRFVRIEDGFKVKLSCVRIVSGSDSNSEHVVWQKEQPVSSGGTEAIPVSFFVPMECVETSGTSQTDRVVWRLAAAGQADGSKYEAQFEVPVIRAVLTAEQEVAGVKLLFSEKEL